MYWIWYKCIENDENNETIGVEAGDEIEIENWGTQGPEGLMHLSRELELDK